MSQPAKPANLNIRVFTQSGSKAALTAPKSDFRYTPQERTQEDIAPCPKTFTTTEVRTHSITSATGEHLAAMVIRAARLAAILLRIARDLQHADKAARL